MNAKKLYNQLEKDFINPELTDEWMGMDPIADFVTENFKNRAMGLVCDFSDEITQIFTAVFPTDEVLKQVIAKGENSLLFLHHPMIWDIAKAPKVFQNMDKVLLQKMKDNKSSIYALHVPLDNFGPYSTGNSLAQVLGIKVEKPFAPYYGGLCGVIGETDLTVPELKASFEKAVGHQVSLYEYGDSNIEKVAVVAGGGNDKVLLEDALKNGANAFVTGITVKNEISKEAHDFAKENKISVLGGTHYSTEKFACQRMTDYFKNLGLDSEFIEGNPGLEDI